MKKRNLFWSVTGIFVLFLTSHAPAQQEQWLQYRSEREVSVIGGSYQQSLELKSEKPSGMELPQFEGEDQLFAKWQSPMIKDGFLWIALDRKHKNGLYDVLYIDSNGDGQLKDESPVGPYRTDQYSTYFGPAKVIFEIPDGPVSYHLNIRYYGYNEYKRLYISSGGWYEGEVTIGDQKQHCVLFDYNANGTFNDKSLDAYKCDRIRIGAKNSQDTCFVGNFINIEGILYCPEVARDGAYVKLKKAENVKYGKIKLQESITEFSAGGENGLFNLKPEKGICTLPVGKYRINSWAIEQKDDKDAKWKLQGSGFSGGRGVFDIEEDKETPLSVGEPVYATLQVSERDSQYVFAQSLQGRDGERIELTRNGSRPQAPKLHIKSNDGEYDRTFSFAYG